MYRFTSCVLAVLLSVAAAARTAPEPVLGPTFKLSPYEVYADSVEFNGWIKVSSPHFVLYTDVKVSRAMELVRHFEMMRFAAHVYFRRSEVRLPPMIVILPTSDSDWAKIAVKGDVQWHAASSRYDGVTTILTADSDWESNGLAPVYGGIGNGLTARMNLSGPFWFDYGIGEFFETVEFGPDSVRLGLASGRTDELTHGSWLPWGTFFQISSSSMEFRSSLTIDQYAAQSALFTQYLLTSPDPVATNRLVVWAALQDARPKAEEAEFKQIFGEDWKHWDRTLRSYLDGGQYQVATVKVPAEAMELPMTAFTPKVREMRELFVLARIINQRVKDSRVSLDAMLKHGVKTDSLRELLITACQSWNREGAVLRLIGQLAAGGSSNPAVYHQAADLIFHRAYSEPSVDPKLSAGDAAEIERLCREALKIEPLYAPANDLLAMTMALGPHVTPDDADEVRNLYRVQKGLVSTCPTAMALAIARWRSGDPARAGQIDAIIEQSPFADDETRTLARTLDRRMAAQESRVR